jgi:hypothetical protein
MADLHSLVANTERLEAKTKAIQQTVEATQERVEANMDTAINTIQERMEAALSLKRPSTIGWRASWGPVLLMDMETNKMLPLLGVWRTSPDSYYTHSHQRCFWATAAAGQGRRSNVAMEVERPNKNRENQRQTQTKLKENKRVLINMGPWHPNWEFRSMIREYHNSI